MAKATHCGLTERHECPMGQQWEGLKVGVGRTQGQDGEDSRSGWGGLKLKIVLDFGEMESWQHMVPISTGIQKHLQNDKVGDRLRNKNAWP